MPAQTKLAPSNVLDKTPAGKISKSSRSHKTTALTNKEKAKIAEADVGENKSNNSSSTSIRRKAKEAAAAEARKITKKSLHDETHALCSRSKQWRRKRAVR